MAGASRAAPAVATWTVSGVIGHEEVLRTPASGVVIDESVRNLRFVVLELHEEDTIICLDPASLLLELLSPKV